MAKKKDIQVRIEEMEFPNKGIGTYEGEKVSIKNTLPGQLVDISVKKRKGRYDGVFINSVIEKAPYEKEPECPKFGICGGCTFQNIDYEKELELKKENVLKLLKNANINDFEFEEPQKCPSIYSYRNKMEFSFGDTGIDGELSLGMRKRASYYEVVNAENCLLIHEDMRKILKTVLDFFKNTDETFYHKTKHIGSLRHLLVRRGFFTGEILAALVTTSGLSCSLDPLCERLKELEYEGTLKGFIHIINDGVADVIKADEMKVLYGQDYFTEKLLGLDFKISVFSFFQTNSQGAEELYKVVRDFAGDSKNKTVFDLYCGTGTIAQIAAQNAKKAIGIEIVQDAVEAAKVNAKLNNIDNCEFIAGDVLKTVDTLQDKPDIIILDPPREGIHPKAIGKIIDFNAPRVVYISCKASSLTKDLEAFIEKGYKIERIKCVDMFGRTCHVETVVLMSKAQK